MRMTITRTASLLLMCVLVGCGRERPPVPVTVAPPAPVEVAQPTAAPAKPDPMPTKPKPAPRTAAAPRTVTGDQSGLDTTYVTEEFIAAIILRPAQVLESPFISDLEKHGASIDERLATFQSLIRLTVDPRNIEQIMFLIDANSASLTRFGVGSFEDIPDEEPMVTMVLRTREPFDAKAIINGIMFNNGETKEAEGQEYVVHARGIVKGAFFSPNDRTLVQTRERLVSEMAVAQDVQTPLTERMATILPDQDLVILFDLEAQREQFESLPEVAGTVARALAGLRELPAQLQFLTLTANLSGETLLNLSLEGDDEKAATKAEELVNLLVNFGKEYYFAQVQQRAGQLSEEVVNAGNDVIESISVTREAETVLLTIVSPPSLAKLPEILGASLKMEKPKALSRPKLTIGNVIKLRSFTRISYAFQRYHEAEGHFPPAGRADAPQVEGSGLSWRVHILPQLGKAELYEKFNLDEPWDSETNKPLIEEMPEEFGDLGPEMKGMSSLHLFVGENAPFGDGTANVSLDDIKDGPEKTILMVEAGRDKAVEWTKPGGLPFNSDDPLSELGAVPKQGILILLMDGELRLLSTEAAAKILPLLIQHADGQTIDEEF